jgi:hypothetical protein
VVAQPLISAASASRAGALGHPPPIAQAAYRAAARMYPDELKQDRPWMWTVTAVVVAPRLPSHGFAVTLDEAKAVFAETWRKWLALKGRAEDQGARIVKKSK